MKKHIDIWLWATVVLGVTCLALVICLLYEPDPVRLHGTYDGSGSAAELQLTFCMDLGADDRGTYALYPATYPYASRCLEQGIYYLRENGVVELHPDDGAAGYAAIDGTGRLWLFSEERGLTVYEKVREAAVDVNFVPER